MILGILIGAPLLFALQIGQMSYNICKAHNFKDGIYSQRTNWDGNTVLVRREPLSCSQWLQLKPNRRQSKFGRGR